MMKIRIWQKSECKTREAYLFDRSHIESLDFGKEIGRKGNCSEKNILV